MKKNYQTKAAQRATADEIVLPETVTLAMAELAGAVREGLLALAVGAGLQVMSTLMAEDVIALCGPRGVHDPQRSAVRHGTEAGLVTLGGRRVPVRRPRVRSADGTGEVPVRSYGGSPRLVGQRVERVGPRVWPGASQVWGVATHPGEEAPGWNKTLRVCWSVLASTTLSMPSNTITACWW